VSISLPVSPTGGVKVSPPQDALQMTKRNRAHLSDGEAFDVKHHESADVVGEDCESLHGGLVNLNDEGLSAELGFFEE